MGTRDDDARAARRLAHVEKIKLHAAAGNILLTEDTLLFRHDRLRLVVEADEYLVALSLEYRTGDDVSDLVGELFVHHLTLGVLELLDDDLPRRLRRNAPEILRQHLCTDDVADLELLVSAAFRLFKGHLRVGIDHLFHDLVNLIKRELTVFDIYVDFGVLISALELLIG